MQDLQPLRDPFEIQIVWSQEKSSSGNKESRKDSVQGAYKSLKKPGFANFWWFFVFLLGFMVFF